MTDYARKIKDKLDVVTVSHEDFNTLCKDRLDFGFDSIYFRYSEAIEELSWFKEQEAHRKGRDFNRKSWSESKRQHFYMCLEQLLHAHEPEDM
jgi:hypothetical protein